MSNDIIAAGPIVYLGKGKKSTRIVLCMHDNEYSVMDQEFNQDGTSILDRGDYYDRTSSTFMQALDKFHERSRELCLNSPTLSTRGGPIDGDIQL